MTHKRPLEDSLLESETNSVLQLWKDPAKSACSQLSLFPFNITVCNKERFSNFFHDCDCLNLHISKIGIDEGNKFQLTTLIVEKEEDICIPISITISFSSEEIQASRTAIRLLKEITQFKSLGTIIGPPSLERALREEIKFGVFHPSHLDVSSRDLEWMEIWYPQFRTKLEESLEMLFFSPKYFQEFLDFWSTACPNYLDYIKQTWKPADCNFDITDPESYVTLESASKVITQELKAVNYKGDFVQLVRVLQTVLDRYYIFYDVHCKQVEERQLRRKWQERNFQEWRGKAQAEIATKQKITDINTINNNITNMLMNLCNCCNTYVKNSRCTFSYCKRCCEELGRECEVREHNPTSKIKKIRKHIIDILEDAISNQKDVCIKLERSSTWKNLSNLAWKTHCHLFKGEDEWGLDSEINVMDVEDAKITGSVKYKDGTFTVYVIDPLFRMPKQALRVKNTTTVRSIAVQLQKDGWGKPKSIVHFAYKELPANFTMEELKIQPGDKLLFENDLSNF